MNLHWSYGVLYKLIMFCPQILYFIYWIELFILTGIWIATGFKFFDNSILKYLWQWCRLYDVYWFKITGPTYANMALDVKRWWCVIVVALSFTYHTTQPLTILYRSSHGGSLQESLCHLRFIICLLFDQVHHLLRIISVKGFFMVVSNPW